MNKKDLIMLHKLIKMLWVMLLFLTPYISMLAMKDAILERGYYAIGGEFCVPLLCYVGVFELITINREIRKKYVSLCKGER